MYRTDRIAMCLTHYSNAKWSDVNIDGLLGGSVTKEWVCHTELIKSALVFVTQEPPNVIASK